MSVVSPGVLTGAAEALHFASKMLRAGADSDAQVDSELNDSDALQVVTAINAAKAQLEAASYVDIEDRMLRLDRALQRPIVPDFGIGALVPTVDLLGDPAQAQVRRILVKLKGVLAGIWHLISRLVTPREWKVSGEIAGGIPALGMPKAAVEITFG